MKSSLVYPNGLTASWTYDANNQLLQVCNAFPTNVISQYDYTYDAAGRRVEIARSGSAMSENRTDVYGYNIRNELVSATKNSEYTEYQYQYDDIGNHSITLNSSTPSLISMSYDRMGRRVTKNDQSFVYNGYLQIANFELQTSDIKLQAFIWDPTEPVATRPLVWNFSVFQPFNFSTSYYIHDGNKNVSEVVAENGDIVAHYEYAPFGSVTAQTGVSAGANPWRFSSEYAEDDTAMVYYNYRHYDSGSGSWLNRDPLSENGGLNLYMMARNSCVTRFDVLGLCCCGDCEIRNFFAIGPMLLGFRIHSMAGIDYGQVSVKKLLKLIGADFVEVLVDTKGRAVLKELKNVFKDILKKVNEGSQIASFIISGLGHIMEVQLEIGTVYSYQRRDCKKKHWYSPRCSWSKWNNIYGIKSDWMSATPSDTNDPLENKFAVEQIVTDPYGVRTKLVESINVIIDEALKNIEVFGPDKVPEISDCKTVEH
jgi:RHS repeat-associated protein